MFFFDVRIYIGWGVSDCGYRKCFLCVWKTKSSADVIKDHSLNIEVDIDNHLFWSRRSWFSARLSKGSFIGTHWGGYCPGGYLSFGYLSSGYWSLGYWSSGYFAGGLVVLDPWQPLLHVFWHGLHGIHQIMHGIHLGLHGTHGRFLIKIYNMNFEIFIY